MSWFPSPTRLIILFKSIEKGDNPPQDTTELFWLFCMKSLPPDEFRDRVLFWINKHLEDSPKGGGFIDPDIRDIILQGSKRVVEIITDRLDTLCEMKRVPYTPDEIDDPESLYVYTLLESSRLTRLLKIEGYSEKVREILAYAINSFARFSRTEISYQNPQWQKEYTIFIEAVGTFLYITQFLILKSDGEYEKSIEPLTKAIAYYIILMKEISSLNRTKMKITEPELINFMNYVTNHPRELPWIKTLEPQIPVNCVEALRNGEHILDPKDIASACGLLVTMYNSWWTLDEDKNEVKDAEGNNWKVIDFWHHASGWLEARLQPSDLRELLDEREDSASEKRLRTYFFIDEIWIKLPERVRSSLISADRNWFSSSVARKEALFNELRTATEELLHDGLWKPLEQRIQNKKEYDNDTKWFTDRKQELSQKGLMPTLLDFERTCRLSITDVFLKEKGIPSDRRIWFCNQLPKSLYHLRRARNRAEHETGDQWIRQDLSRFYNEFIGIGRPGILPELARILLSSDQ